MYNNILDSQETHNSRRGRISTRAPHELDGNQGWKSEGGIDDNKDNDLAGALKGLDTRQQRRLQSENTQDLANL
jgi:hypothetical protein